LKSFAHIGIFLLDDNVVHLPIAIVSQKMAPNWPRDDHRKRFGLEQPMNDE
jgi:hypothetical protein